MPKAERIAFVCPRFAEGSTVGGAETLLKRLAERAAQAGRKVTFLTTCAKSHFTWANELPPGLHRSGLLDVIYFPVDQDRDLDSFLKIQDALCRGGTLPREQEERWIAGSVNSRALCAHLRERGAEYDRIVLGPYLFGLVYFASQIHADKALLVPCLHDEPFAYLAIMREMFHRVRGLMFNTVPEMELAQRLMAVPAAKCAVVGMGLDTWDPEPTAFAERHRLDYPYLLYSGRREAAKGIPLLTDYVNAFRQRTGRALRLVFTGSGPIDAPTQLMPYILDAGMVSEQEKREAMAGAQVFVHPSLYESFSIVLLESFLAGTPALVRAGCEVLQWQCRRSGAGLWFHNYPEFEEELLLLLDDATMRRTMGAAGRAFVQREYAWPAVEARLFHALDNL